MRIAFATLVAAAVLTTGCSIWDEIGGDGGAPAKGAETAQGEEAKATPESGWRDIRSLSPADAPGEFVRCRLDGAIKYMEETDCLSRGGRVEA